MDLVNNKRASAVSFYQKMWAYQHGRVLMKKLLKKCCQEQVPLQALVPILCRIDVNDPVDDKTGQNLMHVCAQKNRADILEHLVSKCQGDPAKQCSKGKSAAEYADYSAECREVLLKHLETLNALYM